MSTGPSCLLVKFGAIDNSSELTFIDDMLSGRYYAKCFHPSLIKGRGLVYSVEELILLS